MEADGAVVPLSNIQGPALTVGLTLTKSPVFVPALLTLLPHHTMETFSWVIPSLEAPQH